jgi:hypothetical protein
MSSPRYQQKCRQKLILLSYSLKAAHICDRKIKEQAGARGLNA